MCNRAFIGYLLTFVCVVFVIVSSVVSSIAVDCMEIRVSKVTRYVSGGV